jgi:hypothetical protein
MATRWLALTFGLALALPLLDPIRAAAEEPWRPAEPELVKILQSEGYGSIERLSKGGIRFKANGMPFVLFRYDDGDLQLYYGISGVRLPVQAVNDWNRTRRLSRAYLDRDGDPVLEADLLANAGLQKEGITEFVRIFVQIASKYRGFVLAEGHRAEPDSLPASPVSEL